MKTSGGTFDKENIVAKIKELETISLKDSFWKDQNLVKKTVKQKKNFEDILNSYHKLKKDLANTQDLFNLATQEKDEDIINDCSKKILQILSEIKKKK